MAEVISMPKLGFDMAEGTLVRWVILEGEAVAKGAILAEIETDKATVEVESTHDGVLARHLVGEGDIVPVNSPIAVVGAEGEDVELEALLGDAILAESESTTPDDGKSASVAPPAPADQVLISVQETEAAPDARLPDGVRASPLARRMALDHGLDLKLVKGSGQGGRIVKRDIEAYLAAPPPGVATSAVAPAAAAPVAAFSPVGPAPADEVVPLNRLRAAIGRRMTEVKQQVPHFYLTREYDMAAVMELRAQVNAMLPEGEKTSVNDYIVKATALALRQYPNLNASLDGEQIIQRGAVNVGVAVAVEGGLLTVVNHDTDRKPVRQIAAEVREMVVRAREGKVRPEDIEGSTFSVSNLGMYEIDHFIAIINPPEAAILAVGAVREVPVVQDGELVPGLRMKATISVDHRVSDGAEAALFMQALAVYFKEPLRLLI
jgi:pyruvate dehydrogenase E2 component (dihydrolipoamide acetyltransferase)